MKTNLEELLIEILELPEVKAKREFLRIKKKFARLCLDGDMDYKEFMKNESLPLDYIEDLL